MKFIALKKNITEGNVSNIYLFEGEDEYFKQAGETMLKDKFLTEPCLNFSVFSGETLKGNEFNSFVSSCRNFPFMSEKRVVKVTNFYPTEKEYETYLKALFEDFPSTTILIIINTLKAKGKPCKLQDKPNVTYVDCSHADEETLLKWIYITFKKAGIVIEQSACDMIMRYSLFDMSKIYAETQKLLAYGDESKLITEKDVDELVYKDSEYKIYEMTNAISKKNYSKFLTIMYELRQKGYDDISLLNSITSYFKTLFEVNELTRNNNDRQVASMLSMKDYALSKNKEQCNAFAQGQLLALYSFGINTIASIKTGKLVADCGLKLMTNKIFFNE